jgi:hypothetical protein
MPFGGKIYRKDNSLTCWWTGRSIPRSRSSCRGACRCGAQRKRDGYWLTRRGPVRAHLQPTCRKLTTAPHTRTRTHLGRSMNRYTCTHVHMNMNTPGALHEQIARRAGDVHQVHRHRKAHADLTGRGTCSVSTAQGTEARRGRSSAPHRRGAPCRARSIGRMSLWDVKRPCSRQTRPSCSIAHTALLESAGRVIVPACTCRSGRARRCPLPDGTPACSARADWAARAAGAARSWAGRWAGWAPAGESRGGSRRTRGEGAAAAAVAAART